MNAKDYIHRVGRTARAGRAGRSITMVTQYDIEEYQKIEHLIGMKLPSYQAEEQEVLCLKEQVDTNLRIAVQELKNKLEKKGLSDERN
jgi:ATP-dependent RNA helicase DDX47/RRP3